MKDEIEIRGARLLWIVTAGVGILAFAFSLSTHRFDAFFILGICVAAMIMIWIRFSDVLQNKNACRIVTQFEIVIFLLLIEILRCYQH